RHSSTTGPSMPVTDHIRNKLSQVPHRPGVYLHKDRFGTVIYVGKARDLRKRVSQYFHPSRRMGWDLKFNALIDAIHDFDWHVVKSEPESLLLEGKLIKEFQPRFNVDFRDDKRFLLLKVNLNDPIPRFTLTRLRKDDGCIYFGPFAHSGSVRRALTLMRRKFHLRGCRPLTPGESDYRHCLYGNLKHCTAPCIGNVSRDDYLAQVRAGIEFLQGQTAELRQELENEMRRAAAALEFEKAAQLRDALEDLQRTTQKTEKFQRIPYTLPVAVNPESDLRELARVLGLPEPPARIEGFDISNISGTFVVASMVSFWHGRPDRSAYRRFRMKSVTQQDDFASMAETVRRRYTRLLADVRAGRASPGNSDDSGEAAPSELQRVVEDVTRATRHQPLPRDADAAAAAISASASPPTTAPGADAEPEAMAPGDGSGLDAPWVPRPGTRARLPDLILIDGGRGQLNAACAELAALGLGSIPILGLAKEFEEIHLPDRPEPLRLGLDSPAVKLLQRVRDEAHRFANTYNAQLRLRRISESLLDEFPGIGDARKKALLKRFGSLQRLRVATQEEIEQVPGFGGVMAAELKAFLAAR
ncbi:MAG: excinuclease ABC subunit UvrC, partial [Verrucomicrobiae bacterium]|nr:excinuclease ABC subunit UvrC [Verrucomicrobiae bacterium]